MCSGCFHFSVLKCKKLINNSLLKRKYCYTGYYGLAEVAEVTEVAEVFQNTSKIVSRASNSSRNSIKKIPKIFPQKKLLQKKTSAKPETRFCGSFSKTSKITNGKFPTCPICTSSCHFIYL